MFTKDFSLSRGSFSTFVEAPPFPYCSLKQVHGIQVHAPTLEEVEGDGWVCGSGHFDWPLGILTADCMPIVVLGNKGHAFVHAGWRGLHAEILGVPEIKEIEPTYAFVGPHIQKCCYEVQSDFLSNFPQSSAVSQKKKKYYFQLSEELRQQLGRLYPSLTLEVVQECTCCNKDFHSFRRNGTKLRNINIFFPN